MKPDKSSLVIPVLLIVLGVGWLLSALGVIPTIDWIWTLGIASLGILSFVVWGIDKVSVVVGPIFLAASLLSTLRQTGRIPLNVEVPLLVILGGALMLVARLPSIPQPKWVSEIPPS